MGCFLFLLKNKKMFLGSKNQKIAMGGDHGHDKTKEYVRGEK
jgi:hypothetical protein